MTRIKLRLLGGFHVDMDGRSMDEPLSHSPKGLQLMQYLILNRGRMETSGELTRAMWPGTGASRPESALKTLVSRLRVLLAQVDPLLGQCLKTVRGGYQWETLPGVFVDVEEYIVLAEGLQGRIDLNDEGQNRRLRRMMELYTGRLLCEQEQPDWLRQRADSLHQLYLAVVEEYIQKLQKVERYQDVVTMCREALDADPLNSQLNAHLMDALVRAGRDGDAMRQYQHATVLTGGDPTALDAYYTRMLQTDRDLTQTLSRLKAELIDGMDKPGALICDRMVFAELFRLEQRSLERVENSTITLGVAMLSGMEDAPWQLDAAMNGLIDVMVRNLRRGDIITRLNATQVGMLLPQATEEDANRVMNRLKRGFYLKFPSGCSLTFALTSFSVGAN